MFRHFLYAPSLVLNPCPELAVLTSNGPFELHCHVFPLDLRRQIHEALFQQSILAGFGIFARVGISVVVEVVQLEVKG